MEHSLLYGWFWEMKYFDMNLCYKNRLLSVPLMISQPQLPVMLLTFYFGQDNEGPSKVEVYIYQAEEAVRPIPIHF